MALVDYTVLSEVKEKLGIVSPDHDTQIGRYIEQVSRMIDTFVFGPATVGFQISGAGGSGLKLVEFHDGGFESIVMKGFFSEDPTFRDAVTLLEDGVQLLQGTDYFIDIYPARTVYRTDTDGNFTRSFAPGRRNIKVNYQTAYIFAPADIMSVAETETARMFLEANTKTGDGGFLAISQRTPDGGDTISYRDSGFSEMSMSILKAYKYKQSFH